MNRENYYGAIYIICTDGNFHTKKISIDELSSIELVPILFDFNIPKEIVKKYNSCYFLSLNGRPEFNLSYNIVNVDDFYKSNSEKKKVETIFDFINAQCSLTKEVVLFRYVDTPDSKNDELNELYDEKIYDMNFISLSENEFEFEFNVIYRFKK